MVLNQERFFLEINKAEADRLDSVIQIFKKSSKKKVLFLSTTANKKNSDFYIASVKENEDTIICHFLIRSFDKVKLAYDYLNIKFDSILVDAEEKCEYQTLLQDAKSTFVGQAIYTVKPNDYTADALDHFIANKYVEKNTLDISIIGTGNLGSKICLKLIERGHNVVIQSRNINKLNNIKQGLDEFKCGPGSIEVTDNVEVALKNKDIIVLCGPGLPIVEGHHVENISKNTLMIDAGNGNLHEEAISKLLKRENEIYILNSLPGLWGSWKGIVESENVTKMMKSRTINEGLRVITTGLVGRRGDIIVDDVDNIKSIIGVCDGSGDLLGTTEADEYLRNLNEYIKG